MMHKIQGGLFIGSMGLAVALGAGCTDGSAISAAFPGKDSSDKGNGSQGKKGNNALIKTTALAPGQTTQCPQGGIRFQAGVDWNNNAVLDPGEVDPAQTRYLCNGSNGAVSLVKTSAEPAGSLCPYGGQKVETGVDDNGNNRLEANEVDNTAYVCNGAPGSNGNNGTNGHNSLIRTIEFGASAYPQCPIGGIMIQVGVDQDDSGVLDDVEVDHKQTRIICHPVDGTHGLTTLFTLTPQDPGSGCRNGGVALSQGVDDNRDGILQEEEIDSTRMVCNGENGRNGHNSLVVVGTVSPGTACPFGGQSISTGLDSSGDGSLSANETMQTSYVCNGAPGSNGANGTNAAVRQESEAPGANCAHGGTAVHSGMDGNNNGQLDSTEVTSTTYVCNGAPGMDGLNSLVRTSTFGAGQEAQCPAGGVRIQGGVDVDRNGVLSDTEVDPAQTRLVCNGADGANGLTTLVAMIPEAAGANCANGGLALHVGLDDDRDNVLDLGEIDNTRHVCNGLNGRDGLNSLVLVQDENPGSNCAFGGKAISTGLDLNSNGMLTHDEVKYTSYVCNGAPGANGADGVSSLIRQDDEPVGANCPYGGIKVRSGKDLDGDGYLGKGEPTTINYVCNGAPGENGHNTLFTQTEELAGTNCVAGGLKIESGLDVNDNGILDPGEPGDPRYVCNGVDGAGGGSGKLMVTTDMISPFMECGTGGGTRVYYGTDDDGDGSLNYTEWDGSFRVCHGVATNSLVNVTDEPAGTNCNLGGKRIATGMDMDRSSILEEYEETQVSYLCKGGGVATRLSSAAWGGVCPRGGLKVETGVDDNENGVLEDEEVDRTSYVCNLFMVQIAAGYSHTCALMSDGTVRCWGENTYGQLGNGTLEQTGGISSVTGLSNVVQIAAGDRFNCAVLSDGTARCWGQNDLGQLGNGMKEPPRPIPIPLTRLTGIRSLGLGSYHGCAVTETGKVYCWGNNRWGLLGRGTESSSGVVFPPDRVVDDIYDASKVVAAFNHSCAVLTSGRMKCWGWNEGYAFGDGTLGGYKTRPVEVAGLTDAIDAAVGTATTCALNSMGRALCWGGNYYGALGNGTTNPDQPTPTYVSTNNLYTAIYGSGSSFCAQRTEGSVQCWGYNVNGELGDGTTTNRNTPTDVSPALLSTSLDTGAKHSCAVRTDGVGYCWGDNENGELGNGTAPVYLNPTRVDMDLSL